MFACMARMHHDPTAEPSCGNKCSSRPVHSFIDQNLTGATVGKPNIAALRAATLVLGPTVAVGTAKLAAALKRADLEGHAP